MYVEHPEFSDILVNLDTHTLVYSVDGGNDYVWDQSEKRWCGTEVDMGFSFEDDLGIDLGLDKRTEEQKEADRKAAENFDPKKHYYSHYCTFDEKLDKYVYTYVDTSRE